MKTVSYPPRESWQALTARPEIKKSALYTLVMEIINDVKINGDRALRKYSREFDGLNLGEIKVTPDEIDAAELSVPDDLKEAIRLAKQNIEKFHSGQLKDEPVTETSPGVKCWRKNLPIADVGLYIPGGTAPLFSTILMLAVPAKIAGCKNIVLCTPPAKDGAINPVLLYTARLAGITEIYRTGGAQAIAAMAYGTESVPAVSKIFGPGNQYVTRAKQLVQLDGIAIDMPAGPSEVLVIADKFANPEFVAADLLSQAEHGTDSQVVLLTTDEGIISKVRNEISVQIRNLPRRKIAEEALGNSFTVLLKTIDECMDFSNLYAPEHLIIATERASEIAGKVKNAGSVFIGKFSCESAGDYASGTNHTLPTNGYAKSYSGVSAESFVKKITFQEVTSSGIKNIGKAIELMAEAEQLSGHSNAVSLRLKSIEDEQNR
jgi:histidinol dehydrogenase